MQKSRRQLLDELAGLQAEVGSLREQGQHYGFLFDEMLDGFALHEIICDPDGRPCDYRFLDVNPAFERLTGLARENLVGRTVLEVLPGTEPYWIQNYGEVALQGSHRQFENFSSELGKTYRVTAFSPKRGQFATIFEDISERARAEVAMRESEEKFRAVLEQFSDGFLLVNKQGLIVEWNHALEVLTGVPRADVLGQPAWQVQWGLMTPQQRSSWQVKDIENLMMGMLAGRQMPGYENVMNVTFKLPDGSEKVVRQSTTVVKTSNGIWLGTLLHDITAQTEAEAALQESEWRYRRLVEFSPDAIAVHYTGRLVYVNTAGVHMVGAGNARELIGRKILEFVHPDSRQLAAERARQVVEDGVASLQVEEKFLRLDGSTLDVEVTSLPFIFQGQPAAQIIVHDVTERKQIELVQAFLAQHGWLSAGEDFFNALARYLARNLEVDYVCIDRLDGEKRTARTLAVVTDGIIVDNFTYALKDTPCGDAVGKTICVFRQDVRHLFPLDEALQELQAESYVGATLWGSNGQPFGLIALIGRKPLKNLTMAETILKLVSGRAAGELERRLAEEALRESNERYRQLVELSPSAVFVEQGGRMVFANQACVNLFGAADAEQLIRSQKCDYEYVHPDWRPKILERVRQLQDGQPNPPQEQRYLRMDGSGQSFDVEVSAASMQYLGGPASLVIAHDITARKQAGETLRQAHADLQEHVMRIEALQEQLRDQANRDYLTGLFNRRYLQDTLSRELARAARENGPVSLVMMDVDHFKLVNDTHGHRAGDLLLETWAEVLKKNTRRQDIACRYGGEEFVIVMPGAGLEAARARAEKLCDECAALEVLYEGQVMKMTISLGVAVFPDHAGDEDTLLIRADRALYRAKRAGRNRVMVY